MTVLTQSSPGVAGTVLASDVPCRYVTARNIFELGFAPTSLEFYVTTDSVVPVAPTYSFVRGIFTQAVDFAPASVLRDQSGEFVDLVVVREDVVVYLDGSYQRFHSTDLSLLAPVVVPGETCPVPLSLPLSTSSGTLTLTLAQELWFSIPSGCTSCTAFVTAAGSVASVRFESLKGDCATPVHLFAVEVFSGGPAVIPIAPTAFRLKITLDPSTDSSVIGFHFTFN